MVDDPERLDPYVTPQTPPATRLISFSALIILSGVVLLTISASAFIINNAWDRGIQLRRSSIAIENYMPYIERGYEVKAPPFPENYKSYPADNLQEGDE
jgi:hypothetical protein